MWKALIKSLKKHGYTGKDDDLDAIKAYIDEHFGGSVDIEGKAFDIDGEHAKAYPSKPKLDISSDAKDLELEETKALLAQRDTELELLGKGNKARPGSQADHTETIKVGKDRLVDDPKGGFKSVSEWLIEVKNLGGDKNGSARPEKGTKLDVYTKATLSTYGSEGTGADGGFAVIPEFRAAIDVRVTGEDSLLSRCTVDPVSGNALTINQDETTPWQTSGGITAEWEGEAGSITQSKPLIKQASRKLRKITALVALTDELMADSAAMGSYVMRKAPEKIDFKIGEALIRGSGVGMPLGFLNSAALISVAKETTQEATSIKATNVQKMFMRMYAQYRRNAVWLYNQDMEQQLQQMVVVGKTDKGTSVAVGGLIYIPPGTGLSGDQYGSLMGRPMIPSQHCASLGSQGDIMLVDFSQYWCIRKASGIETASSIHLWFDQSITAFRFVYRLDGGPMNNSTISPRAGSNTMSAFIALDAR